MNELAISYVLALTGARVSERVLTELRRMDAQKMMRTTLVQDGRGYYGRFLYQEEATEAPRSEWRQVKE